MKKTSEDLRKSIDQMVKRVTNGDASFNAYRSLLRTLPEHDARLKKAADRYAESRDSKKRVVFYQMCANIKSRAAWDALYDGALFDTDPRVYRAALKGLKTHPCANPDRRFDPWIAHATDPDSLWQNDAIDHLGKQEPNNAVIEITVQLMERPVRPTQWNAIRRLGCFDDARITKVLTELVAADKTAADEKDTGKPFSSGERHEAYRQLARHHAGEQVTSFLLKHCDSVLNTTVFDGLHRRSGEAVSEALVEAVCDYFDQHETLSQKTQWERFRVLAERPHDCAQEAILTFAKEHMSPAAIKACYNNPAALPFLVETAAVGGDDGESCDKYEAAVYALKRGEFSVKDVRTELAENHRLSTYMRAPDPHKVDQARSTLEHDRTHRHINRLIDRLDDK